MLCVAVPSDPPFRHLCKSSPYHADLRTKDGSTVRLEFAYCVPRTLNRTVPAYCTSVLFLKRTVPTCRTRTITKKVVPYQRTVLFSKNMGVPYRTYQRWSRGHKARGQGQGHKKNPRPRTAFPRTHPLEAKDRNARGQGQSRKCSQKKKRSSKKFFRQSPIYRRSQNF